MSLMLSPGLYLRCSENSTEKPWNGLAWRPAMNPSTMNLARRSSRETWRITSGLRYFSWVPANGVSSSRGGERGGPRGGRGRARSLHLGGASAVVLRDLGLADL